jgi:hypothetical protein
MRLRGRVQFDAAKFRESATDGVSQIHLRRRGSFKGSAQDRDIRSLKSSSFLVAAVCRWPAVGSVALAGRKVETRFGRQEDILESDLRRTQ